MARFKKFIICFSCLLIVAGGVQAIELKSSVFEKDLSQVRYFTARDMADNDDFSGINQTGDDGDFIEQTSVKGKSPFKAMVLSMAVPGLGQWYNGSKLRSVIYFGAEIATWAMYFKWHGEGNDMTSDFEAFNRAHWSEQRYSDNILWTYGYSDDELVPPEENAGITHHLPDTRTQQYYEMTGKYGQFAWGWDDAVDTTNGYRLYDGYDEYNPPPKILTEESAPYSPNRMHYEDMRHDANSKFDNANKMIIVSIVNRLISGFEAYFTTKSMNKNAKNQDSMLSRIKIRASLKSYYTQMDTPMIKVTYKF